MKKDTAELFRRCELCQKYTNIQHQLTSQLTSIIAPWPFAQWKIDILGPFPPTSGQRKFIVVTINYFTKWVEAKSLAQITESKMEDFIQKSIICRFGLPHTIITNNDWQFDNQNFKKFYLKFYITYKLTSVGHPQSNSEVKMINRIILHDLKIRLNEARGLWVEELYPILWVYRITLHISMGESSFNLAYRIEAIILLEIRLPSVRVEQYNELSNSEYRRADLDLDPKVRQ